MSGRTSRKPLRMDPEAKDQGGHMTRRERLAALIDEYGCASICDVLYDPEIHRWALMEADGGPADNGGPWWNTSNNWEQLLRDSEEQERPDDWPAIMLFDLDSDWATGIGIDKRPRYYPVLRPMIRPLTD